MLCIWYHLSTQRQQEKWRHFLQMRSKLASFQFSCCILIFGDVDCNYCMIFNSYIQQHCDTFSYSGSIISFLSRISSVVNCCYFITAANDVIVSLVVGTFLTTLVYLEQSILPVRLVPSRFLTCQWISDCLLSQSFY